MPHPPTLRLAVTIVAIWCGVGWSYAPAAAAHDAPMRGDARHGRLVDEPWVMLHWVPFDEREAERELGLAEGQLEAFLYNDHHTLAQLARRRGIEFEQLVDRLVAWADEAPGADRATVEQRIRLMLVSGHLAQHVLYHVFHGSQVMTAIKQAASLSEDEFAARRRNGWSSSQLVSHGGGDPAAVEGALSTQLAAAQERGAALGETPSTQAIRMGAFQQSLLPCWFTRPPQAVDPSAPYGRKYLLHRRGHTSADMPVDRAAQAREDRSVARGLAALRPSCWKAPGPFAADPGPPLTRRELRRLARLPDGFRGPVNGPKGHHPDAHPTARAQIGV